MPLSLFAQTAAEDAALPDAPAPATAVVDWTRSDGQVNRALFSTQGFMQVNGEPNPMVMETFTLLNPAGTQTRLETYIHQMEPENDNDDPDTFNWAALHPDKQIRFVKDHNAFLKTVAALGMEPLALLCYNVDWLRSNNPDDQIADRDEWAEFAAAVVQSYNGIRGDTYKLNLRLVEIWNEPNFSDFRIGTMDAYFDLFNKTARRIHRDYPGVLVGGPAVTKAGKDAGDWMDGFIQTCGPDADYIIYHVYGEPVESLIADTTRWTQAFRQLPGKAQGKMMITETDQWIQGWPKMQYVLERQFRFLDISDLVLGLHHFCCMAYNESGNYTFGIVEPSGAVLGGTFWPYWLFRNLIGHNAAIARGGERRNDFDLAAAWNTNVDGQFLATAVFHNRAKTRLPIDTFLYFPPSKNDRVLVFNHAKENEQGVGRIERVPAGADHLRLGLTLEPGEGRTLTLQTPGARFFAFRDLNNQETPWIGLTANKESIGLGEECRLRARILNTTFTPVSGTLTARGLPPGWTAGVEWGDAKIENLGFGQSREVVFRFRAASVLSGGAVAPFVVLETGEAETQSNSPGENSAADNTDNADGAGRSIGRAPRVHSIPVSVGVRNPLSVQPLPLPVRAVAGDRTQVTLQLSNQVDQAIEGTVVVRLPEGLTLLESPAEFRLPAGARERIEIPFSVAPGVEPGELTGHVHLEFLGSSMDVPFAVSVSRDSLRTDAVPLDLTALANFDAVAFAANRIDYDSSMGLFSYPGDYTPSGRIVNIRGVPFRMLPLEDGKKNCILPKGQAIAVPEGSYSGAMFMGVGHDGKHPGTWTFWYADGSSETVESQIPEWCSPLPPGSESFQEAFSAPYRYTPHGPGPPACQLFTWTLRTDPARTLKGIQLPTLENGAYLFAITLLK